MGRPRVTIVIPLRAFLRCLRSPLASVGGAAVESWLGLGIHTAHDRVDLIGAAEPTIGRLRLLISRGEALGPPTPWPSGCGASLMIGRARTRGLAAGFWRVGGEARPVDELRLIGPGMHLIPLERGPGAPVDGSVAGASTSASIAGGIAVAPEAADDPGRLERWSRTIGALGPAAWRTLTGLHVGVIGAGPTADGFVAALTRVGLTRLTRVADPGAAPIAPAFLDALGPCNLLVSTALDVATRAAISALAVLYCKPLLDLTTAVASQSITIALLLPGHCLQCAGLLRAAESVSLGALLSTTSGQPLPLYDPILADLAIGVGLRMLEDLIVGGMGDGLVTRMAFDLKGRLRVEHPLLASSGDCPLCALSGSGDAGLRHWSSRA